jgi:uncharacterized protein (DUF342 family)
MKKTEQKKEIIKNKEEGIKLARRCYQNALETLKKSPINYGIRYEDSKYVSEASGAAYLAGLKAIEAYLIGVGMHPDDLPTDIIEYRKELKKIPHNGKLMAALNNAYENLHLFAYYRGGVDVKMVKSGFESVKLIIGMLSK